MEGTATVPSGSTTTGPTSFSDPGLTWSEASSASTPTSDSTPAASASAETTPPSAASDTPAGQPQQGEPPKERWEAILQNARTKAAEEALAPYAWAKQVDPREFQSLQQIAKHFAGGDVEQGLKSFLAELQKDPQTAAQLKSIHARELAALRQRPPATAPEPPQMVRIQLEDGTVVETPRDPNAWLAHQKQQWAQEQRQELQPVVQTVQQWKAQQEAQAQKAEVDRFVTSTYGDMTTWPGMDSPENQAKVAEAIKHMELPANATNEHVLLAAERAWRKVVAPQLSKQAETKLLDSLKTKAAASSSVNPGSAASSTPKSYASFYDLPKSAWK